MTSKSGHPDDDKLQRLIETAKLDVMYATTRGQRHKAWARMKELLALRSEREIQARERTMRWALDHVS
jgi:hypothetical protein